MAEGVRVRCRQTGFRATIPVTDWDAYTDDQRAAYEVLDAVTAPEPEPALPKPKKG